MWGDFCELALFGGPPHRGPENPLRAVAEPDPLAGTLGNVAEIQRGIWETTGLDSDLVRPGWLAIPCESRRMAAWMCAAVILENVDARCEGECLLVPASERFALENEVKSIITVGRSITGLRLRAGDQPSGRIVTVAVTSPAPSRKSAGCASTADCSGRCSGDLRRPRSARVAVLAWLQRREDDLGLSVSPSCRRMIEGTAAKPS
jgi:hypothetical protein